MKKRCVTVLLLVGLALSPSCYSKPQRSFKNVVFQTNLHCEKCAEKIRENIAFEKGVQDLKVDAEKKTVEVRFDEAKSDTLKLRKAINHLGYDARVISFE